MNFKELYDFFEMDLFKEEIKEFRKSYPLDLKVFQETPLYTGNYGGSFNLKPLRDVRLNLLKKSNKKEGVYLFNNSLPLEIYSDFSSNIKEYSLVFNNDIACYVYFLLLENNGIEINSSWNNLEFKGLFNDFFWNFLLKNYDYIQSSDNNSKQGSEFWIKTYEKALAENKRFSIVNLHNLSEIFINQKDYLRNHFHEIWNNSSREIRLRIYKN